MQELQELVEPKIVRVSPQRAEITLGWHIVLCVPNREITAVAGMTDRGFEGCCPCDYIRRRTGRIDAGGRPVLSNEPSPKALIPGYAFVRFKAGKDPDYNGVKDITGVRGFYKLVTADPKRPKYAGLRDSEIEDLRIADRLAFERFQELVLPKAKRKPDVEFEKGKSVRFTTKFGNEVWGQMEQKRGGGLVEVITANASYIVPHFDLSTTSCEQG